MRFIFFVTVFFVGMLAYAALGYLFWQNRASAISKRLAIVFSALALGWFMELVAESFGYIVRPKYTPGFAISWWTARALKTFPAVWLVLSMLQRPKPQHAGNSESAKTHGDAE